MKIIDTHVHLGDIYCGHKPSYHSATSNLSHFLPRLNEFLGFRLMHNSFLRRFDNPERAWHFVMDCVGISETKNLSRSLNKTGITFACVLALEPNVKTDWIIEQKETDKRIIPILSVHPKDLQKKEKLAKYIQKGCKGLKLHPILQDFSPESDDVFELVEEVKKYNIPIICHTGYFSISPKEKRIYGEIKSYEKLVQHFPNVIFIMAHMNVFRSQDAFSLARKYENIYLETSWQTSRHIREAINKIGSKRILFGSDWPYAYQDTSLKVIYRACKKEDDLENILFNNAEKLFNIMV